MFLVQFIFFLILQNSFGQTIPASRTVDWSLAGVRDSMPDFLNVLNIIDYGANADGVTPDDSAFNAALNALNGNAGVLFFPAGSYAFSQNLILRDSLILRGAGADSTELKFVAPISGDLIKIEGSISNIKYFVNQDAFKNETFLFVDSASHFGAGDYIRLTLNDSLLVTSSWAYNTVGQIIMVSDVSGDTLLLASPLRMDYPLSARPQIVKINPVKYAGLECLKIKRTATDAFQSSNIKFSYAANCRLLGIESDSCNFAHVEISNSTNLKISNSYFHDAFDFGGGGKAYGVMIHFTSGECLMENNIFRRLRHSMILQAGANGNVFSYNYSIDPFWTGVSLPANSAGDMVLHGNYVYSNLFEGNIGQNIVIDDSHGSNGPYNTFFRNRAELFGIFMNNAPPSNLQNFVGNEITNNTFPYGLYFLNGTGHFEFGNNVKGTITPANTNSLPDSSYYLSVKPDFLSSLSQYPHVGIPNALGSGENKASLNYATGVFAYCGPEAEDTLATSSELILSIENTGDINIFPNPAENEFHISINKNNHFTLEIFNNLGISIESRFVTGNTTLSAHSYHPGLYYLVFRNKEGKIFSKKLILQ